jgi:hypothetical protein
MRQISGIVVILAFLISCSASFRKLDCHKFNEKIRSRTDIATPEELIKLYYNYPESEGTPKLSVQTVDLGKGNFEITLIHEGLEDDSQSAEKIVMTAHLKGQVWTVNEIEESWKCWDGRGHTNWGTSPCD